MVCLQFIISMIAITCYKVVANYLDIIMYLFHLKASFLKQVAIWFACFSSEEKADKL